MAVPVSTVPAVRAAMVAGITSQVGDTNVGVFYGEQGRHKKVDTIEVGDVERDVSVFAIVGNGQAGAFQEVYTVLVTVTSRRGGDDPATVDARAWALLASVETFIRNDRTLGGRLIDCYTETSEQPPIGWDRDAQNVARGRVATIVTPIHCHAVI